MIPTVYLTGIPNAGKTTLFNGLTGKSERVGNWYGVTTKAAVGYFYKEKRTPKKKIRVVDLPGSYFDGYTLEQRVIGETLTEGIVLVVCPAGELKSGLNFLQKVRSFGCSVVLVINFYEEFKKRGGQIDFAVLRSLIGVPVVVAECNRSEGVSAVKNAVFSAFRQINQSYNRFDADLVAQKVLVGQTEQKLYSFDRLLLKPPFAAAVIAVTAIFALYLAFGRYGIGSFAAYLTERALNIIITIPAGFLLDILHATEFIKGFVIEGVIGGSISVLTFLPRLAVLTLYTCIIEESGVLARLAFACHGILSRLGLSGRAVFAILTGFGCTAVGVLSSGGLENEKIRKRAVLSLPFVPCSAKVPVVAWLSVLIGAKGGFLAVLCLWTGGLILSFIFSFLIALKDKKRQNLIVEFPPYRIPAPKTVAKVLQNFIKSFIIRIGSIIALVTAFLWILKTITPEMCIAEDINKSMLVAVAEKVQFIFYPAGVKNWCFAVAAFAGIFAKENVLSVFSLMGTNNASVREIIAFSLFFALYPPCLSTLIAICKQEGVKSMLHVTCCHTVLALIAFYSVFKPYYLLLLLPVAVVYFFGCGNRIIHNEKNRCSGRMHGKQTSFKRI